MKLSQRSCKPCRVQKASLKDVTFSGHPVPTRLTLCNVMELDHKMIGHLIVKVNCLPTNHHKMMAVAANWQQQKESREELFYCSTQFSSVQPANTANSPDPESSSAPDRSAPYLAVGLELKLLSAQLGLAFCHHQSCPYL